MERISADYAAKLAGGVLKGDGSVEISSVSLNSRNILPGGLFVPLKGENADGHDFINDAAKNGAAAAFCSKDNISSEIPLIMVSDVSRALMNLGARYRDNFDLPIVGITGSVGKTTTKEMTAAVISQKFDTLKTEGNLNGQQGVPLTLMRLENRHRAAVIEMGLSNFSELSALSHAARPNVAIITNIGLSHVEFLGSREGVLKAKLEILDGLAPDGTLIINGDDDMLSAVRDKVSVNCMTYGINNKHCDIRAENIQTLNGGLEFIVKSPIGDFSARIASIGKHNILNALAAAAAGIVLGLDGTQIAKGLAEFKTKPMRQHIFEKNGFYIIDDTYNASYDSIVAALKMLADIGGKGARKFAVLGGIGELGDMHEQIHLAVGEQAAKYADVLYLFGKGSEFYAAGALKAGMPENKVHVFSDKKELSQQLRNDAKQGDALLFKGSRFSMRMEQALQMFLGEEVI